MIKQKISDTENRILGMMTKTGRHYTAAGVAKLLNLNPVVARTRLGYLKSRGLVQAEAGGDGKKSYFATPSLGTFKQESGQVSASESNISNPPQQAEVQTEVIEATPTESAIDGWRPISGGEETIINRMRERGKVNGEFGRPRQVRVTFRRNGNFTLALVKAGHNLFIGEAKRNPKDPETPTVGHDVAFTRALRSQPVRL